MREYSFISKYAGYLLLLLLFIPVLSNKYFPSEDGPVHVDNAQAYLNYDNPATPVFKEYYVKNSNPEPNTFIYLMLSSFQKVLSPAASEKVLIILYIVLMFFSFGYLLKSVGSENRFLIFIFFPFIMNYMIHLGFYNFCYSLALYFFTLGYWIRHYKELRWSHVIILSLLPVVIFFFHPVSLIMYFIASGTMAAGMAVQGIMARHDSTQSKRSQALAGLYYSLRYVITLLPAIVLFLFFLKRQGVSVPYYPDLMQIKGRIPDLVTLASLYSFTAWELVLSTILSILIAILVIVKLSGRIRNKGKYDATDLLFVVASIYVIIYFLSPDAFAGGSLLIIRLLLFPFFILILWVSDYSYNPFMRRFITIAGIIITAAYTGIYTYKYHEVNRQIDEYVTCIQQIDSNSVVLNISGSQRARYPDGSLMTDKVAPFWNIGSRINYYKPVVDLSNYMAWTGYGILDYRPGYNPATLLHGDAGHYWIGYEDIEGYHSKSKGQIDYVILWNYKFFDDSKRNASFMGRFLRWVENSDMQEIEANRSQINRGYRLIFTSKTGMLELYRKIPS